MNTNFTFANTIHDVCLYIRVWESLVPHNFDASAATCRSVFKEDGIYYF